MNERFQVDIRGLPVTVDIRRNSRRRTRVGMSFRADGSLCVDAPPGLLMDEVRSIVMDHSRWVRYRSERAVSEIPYWYPEEYLSGSIIGTGIGDKRIPCCPPQWTRPHHGFHGLPGCRNGDTHSCDRSGAVVLHQVGYRSTRTWLNLPEN